MTGAELEDIRTLADEFDESVKNVDTVDVVKEIATDVLAPLVFYSFFYVDGNTFDEIYSKFEEKYPQLFNNETEEEQYTSVSLMTSVK